MFEGSHLRIGRAQLEPGDALVMYSDGMTEAEDPAGQPFDEAGLERTLALYPGAFPERPRPASARRFSTPSSVTGGIRGWPTTSRFSC